MTLRFDTNVEPLPGYRLLERLGSGGFGEVWKCEVPGGIFKAVKIIHGDLRSKDNDLVRYAEQELKAMKRVKSVRHPFLLAIDRYDIIEGRLLIVMELADCNLWDRFRQCRLNGLPGIGREDLLNYMLESAEVLDLMNFEHQLLHLDIKPQNLFLQYNHVKVGDFGQVKDLEGIMASVTGGITPVYAAPETFDGVVTRFCDQYSLACVYQELLSGQRPFDGASMQQLLMQHVSAPPNLTSSPPNDRLALERALAKKPEDRFSNCMEFVKALRQGMPSSAVPIALSSATTASRTSVWSADSASAEGSGLSGGSTAVAFATTGIASTPLPEQLADVEPPNEAPPEQTGSGPLRPTLVIGVGGTGRLIVQRLRKQLNDRYGNAAALPAIRSLFIDTDPDSLTAAVTDRSFAGLAAMKPEEVFAARLNRATHYLKPRQTGRTLIEGWFDAAMLHRLTRNPETMGLRAFGRLALCDHYRSLMQKIEAELENCLTPEALTETMERTGLPLGSNRPRVYLAASLAGGTGGGMVIDLAYILRNRLRKFGYASADVVGLLMVPPDDGTSEVPPIVRANVMAALTELNHFSRPGSVFQSFYDDRHAYLRDPEPPFARLYLLPAPLALPPSDAAGVGTPPRSGLLTGRGANAKVKDPVNSGAKTASLSRTATIRQSGTVVANSDVHQARMRTLENDNLQLALAGPTAAVADWLRLEMLNPLCSATPVPSPDDPTTATTWGMARYEWPRSEIVARTAITVSGVMLDQWVLPDQSRARDVIPAWTAKFWAQHTLDLEGFIDRMRQAADRANQSPIEPCLTKMSETAIPKGWLARLPDPSQVRQLLVQWEQMIGHSSYSPNRPLTPIEEAMRSVSTDLALAAQTDMSSAVPALIDTSKFRLAGAEEAARQLLSDVSRMTAAMSDQVDRLDAEAAKHYATLNAHAQGTARLQAAAVAEALQRYPLVRYQGLLARRAARTYAAFTECITALKHEVANCRQRLVNFKNDLRNEVKQPQSEIGIRQVLPPGCINIEDAAKRYLEVLTDDDLQQMDAWVQSGIESSYGGLYQACLNTGDGATGLLDAMRVQTRAYLNTRLGEVDLAAMFTQKFGPPSLVCANFRQAFEDAAPKLIESGLWSKAARTIFASPNGTGGEPLRAAARQAIPDVDEVQFATVSDEVVLYREYAQVPLAALPQCGPAWQEAYAGAFDMLQCSPHTRLDVTQWIGLDH